MANELKKIQNRIYKTTNTYTGNIYSDDAWQHVKELIGIIRSVEGVNDVIVGAGQYHNYINKANPTDSAYRDYETTVITDFGNLYGYIRCCAAGKVDDPFSSYDMLISLYPDRKRDKTDMYERKIVVTNKQLNEIAKRLNEYQDTATVTLVPDEGDERSAAGVARTIQKNKQDIERTVQSAGGPVNIKVAGDNTNLAPVNAQVPENGSVSQAADNLSQDQGAERLLSQGASTIFTNEDKLYTKKQLEEMRINNIKKNGVVKTKKQLEEEFKARS